LENLIGTVAKTLAVPQKLSFIRKIRDLDTGQSLVSSYTNKGSLDLLASQAIDMRRPIYLPVITVVMSKPWAAFGSSWLLLQGTQNFL